MNCRHLTSLAVFLLCGCLDGAGGQIEAEPIDLYDNVEQQGLFDCSEHKDVGYDAGDRFTIAVVAVDGRPVEKDTANAYIAMQAAAARAGVGLRIISGFRTMDQQRYLYGCYINCNCNSCNLAAPPGYSNHQSGSALDLNTSEGGVYGWLDRNASRFGFRRTVPSEDWHWEYDGSPRFDAPCGEDPQFAFTVLDGDFDGDGRTDLATVSKNAPNGWRDGISVELARDASFGSSWFASQLPARMKNNANADVRVLTGDVDGDGKTDLVAVSPDGDGAFVDAVAVELARDGRFASSARSAQLPVRMRNGGKDSQYVVRMADFDGDGDADIAALSKNAGGSWDSWIAMELSSAGGFSSEVWAAQTPQRMRNGGAAKRYVTLTGDYNGDGRADLATLSQNAGGNWDSWIAMELSTGTGFVSERWDAALPTRMRNGGADRDYRVVALDLNGDGLTDLATVSPDAGGVWKTSIAVERSTGTGFTSALWDAALPGQMRAGGSALRYDLSGGDLDGDGNGDIIVISKDADGWRGGARVELARPNVDGGRFASQRWVSETPGAMRDAGERHRYLLRAGDVDGDGRLDLITVSPDAGGPFAKRAMVDRSTGTGLRSLRFEARTPERMRAD